MDISIERVLKIKKYTFWINADPPVANNLTNTELPPFI